MSKLDKLFTPSGKASVFLERATNAVLAGLLWLAFCIPVVTIGSSTAALYYVTVKVVRRRAGALWAEFWSAFKRDLGRNILLTVIYLAYIALVYLACRAADIMNTHTWIDDYYPLISRLFYIPVALSLPYLFPIMSRFDYTVWGAIRAAFYMSLRHLLHTLGILAILFLLVFLTPYAPIIMALLAGPACLLISLLIEHVFGRYMPKKEDFIARGEEIPWYVKS